MKFQSSPRRFAFAAITLSAMAALPAVGQTINEDYKLLASDGASGDAFGYSTAIWGTRVIIGAPDDEDNGSSSGSAYLFDTTSGEQIAKLLPNDGDAGHSFGISVGITGTMAIIGAPGDDDNGFYSGSAYLFNTITGQQIAKLLPNDGAFSDNFGTSIAISGTTALVGSPSDDDNGFNSGSAYLFDTITGLQIAKLLPSDGAAGDAFGTSVAISGTKALVGAYRDDDNGISSGSAYIFDTTTGQQIAKLLPEDGAERDLFGISVAISGTTAVVGAEWESNENGSRSGSAYIFDTTTGQQIFKLLANDGAQDDFFGRSVGISGATAIVGAYWDDDNNIENSGSAYLFDTTTGLQVAKLLASDSMTWDYLGNSVAISGTTAVVGSSNNLNYGNGGPYHTGAAYFFNQYEEDEPDAAFILHAVHGQVPNEFNPFSAPSTPTWLLNITQPLNSQIVSANLTRETLGIPGIASASVGYTDWTSGTGEGTPLIAASRFMYIVGQFANLNPLVAAANTLAADLAEAEGRRRAGVESRRAAVGMYQAIRDEVLLARSDGGDELPIFLDIIAHSRGTTVASEALRLLADDPLANGLLEVNAVNIDVIDSHFSENDLPRPFALAGHLLGDPVVERRAGEQIHHLVSDCAVLCSSPSCSLEDVWFFTAEQLCELRDLGLLVSDTILRSYGYPQGHPRQYLSPAYEQIVPGTTHASVLDDFVGTAVSIDPTSPQTPTPESFGARTAVGRYMTSGLLEPIPTPVPFTAGRSSREARSNDQPLVVDPDFEIAGQLRQSVNVLLADPEFNSLLSPAFQSTRELLDQIGDDSLNVASAWETVGDVELRELGNGNHVVTVFSGDVSQNVTTPSPQNDTWKVSTQLVLFQNGGVATIEIETDQGITQLMDFDTNAGDPSGVLLEADALFTWNGEAVVSVRASGNGFNLHSLDIDLVVPCLADMNADGQLDFFDVSAFIVAYQNLNPTADFNSDGVFNFFDVSVFLTEFLAGCP